MGTISFSPPDITDVEIGEVVDTLRSGWITTGPKTKRFEKLLADYIGVGRVACLGSQTAAAETVFRLLGLGEGDEVVSCAYTYTATCSAIAHVGARIVLVDCQKDSCEIDYDALEAAINERTKAVVPIDLGGVPCDYDRIFDIVERKRGLFRPRSSTEFGLRLQEALGRVAVVADAAHALGAVYKGRMIGSVADFTNFSFHAVKNLTTGEGGASAWRPVAGIDDQEIYNLIQLRSLHGQSKDALSKTRMGSWEYDIVGLWHKCNMTDIAASIGLGQLRRYPGLLERRRQIIERYDAAFRPLGIQTLEHFTKERQSSGHLYITRTPGITENERSQMITRMAEAGIVCNVHYKPLPLFTAYKELGFDIKDFPNAHRYFANEITLPLHTLLSDEDVEYVIENFSRIVKEHMK